ncbi:hypothetical protein N8T08_000480 [Aspergillus melleus]|uniref:Uncharacterized protein n=1 Tax=Aspergillus melleus TaxID=138277 RepID=A0ACC3BCK3_9EURO|nr:hypothetical protein N8T08_000480 [Aspergillus melleus]
MHVISRIKDNLNKQDHGKILITPDEVDDAEAYLERQKIRYSYNSATGYLLFYMPSFIHESVFHWVNRWFIDMVVAGHLQSDSLWICGNIKLKGFGGDFFGSAKVPDIFIVPGDQTSCPLVAFEVGYSETFDDLKGDAQLLLEGSEGNIKTVVLIKLEPMRSTGQTCVEAGFVEIYVYDKESGKSRKCGNRMTLLPIPKTHARQRIQLEWTDLLGERLDLHISGTPRPHPLMLDELRKVVELSTKKHLDGERGLRPSTKFKKNHIAFSNASACNPSLFATFSHAPFTSSLAAHFSKSTIICTSPPLTRFAIPILPAQSAIGGLSINGKTFSCCPDLNCSRGTSRPNRRANNGHSVCQDCTSPLTTLKASFEHPCS